MPLKPGDHVALSRDGKVFLTQYTAVSAFVSLARTIGPDPAADVAEMHATLDAMFHDQLLRNLGNLNNATEAIGAEDGGQAERLAHYLNQMRHEGTQEETHQAEAPAPAAKGPVRKRRV